VVSFPAAFFSGRCGSVTVPREHRGARIRPGVHPPLLVGRDLPGGGQHGRRGPLQVQHRHVQAGADLNAGDRDRFGVLRLVLHHRPHRGRLTVVNNTHQHRPGRRSNHGLPATRHPLDRIAYHVTSGQRPVAGDGEP